MAKKFSFRLERVLDLRAQLEDQARMALANAQADYDEGQRNLETLQERLSEHMAKQAESRKSSGDMWLWENYRRALENDVAEARVRMKSLARALQKARQDVVDRSRDKKLLEKLKETQARKHDEEESSREQKENEEMSTLRFQPSDLENSS
ncbi:flagellar export protein FliJ [Desulfovibrio oxyclinae]|jgi:flagellar FliJ protein|uniref:flagellar export protein FliJ n=1 Tax=Desulfovibrio oxyclinae TaxID=63560 RepID=UPI0003691272|nr:flagellar export protein FliJ [Desulfovibrio oxyclinae]